MDTRVFEHFLEVVRSGSFAAAARKMDMDPSVISRSIKNLETDLGVRLFQRTTRSLSLTEAGEQFRSRIEGLVFEIENIKNDFAEQNSLPKGRLCITASVAFGQMCITPHIDHFRKQYPDIDLELKFTDRNVDLVAENVDLAIRLAPSLDIDVITSKLMSTRYRVCASPEYLQGSPNILEPHDIQKHRPVCFEIPAFQKRWIFKKDTKDLIEVPVNPGLVVSSALAIRELTLRGMGPSLLADWLIMDDLEQGTLVDVFPKYEVTATNFDTAAWLVYPSRAFLPYKTRVAIDFLRKILHR